MAKLPKIHLQSVYSPLLTWCGLSVRNSMEIALTLESAKGHWGEPCRACSKAWIKKGAKAVPGVAKVVQDHFDLGLAELGYKALDQLREAGWSVAVHNDYRKDGERFTFWLFTPSGSSRTRTGPT